SAITHAFQSTPLHPNAPTSADSILAEVSALHVNISSSPLSQITDSSSQLSWLKTATLSVSLTHGHAHTHTHTHAHTQPHIRQLLPALLALNSHSYFQAET